MPIARYTKSKDVPNNPRTISEDEVAVYRRDGWQIEPDEKPREPVAMPVPAFVVAPEPKQETFTPVVAQEVKPDEVEQKRRGRPKSKRGG